ncbi:MAG: J domain-containing protein [Bdellovibrionia bacterium]
MCAFCRGVLEGFLALSVCSHCGRPQPVLEGEDPFRVFGMPRKFALDFSELEIRFYQLSRLLHPDRFTNQSSDDQALSLARMSWINQAYSTLSHRASLRAFLVSQVSPPGEKNQSPASSRPSQAGLSEDSLEISQAWFELQEELFEHPEQAQSLLAQFQVQLTEKMKTLAQHITDLEHRYDSLDQNSDSAYPILLELKRQMQTETYLRSIERDGERLKKNANSN